MGAIKNYNNTQYELKIAQERLNVLLNKKNKLHSKYFSITSQIKPIVTSTSSSKNKMESYMIELTKINKKTGMSLDEELRETTSEVFNLQESLKNMTENLIELHGIEYDLYRLIVINNFNISNAVEKIAEKYQCDNRTVWRTYDKKIKKILKCQ